MFKTAELHFAEKKSGDIPANHQTYVLCNFKKKCSNLNYEHRYEVISAFTFDFYKIDNMPMRNLAIFFKSSY